MVLTGESTDLKHDTPTSNALLIVISAGVGLSKPGQCPQRRQIGPFFLPARENVGYSLVEALPRGSRPILPAGGTPDLSLLDGGLVQGIGQLQNGLSPDQGLFMVVSDVDVEHMDWSVQRGATIEEVVHHRVPAPFFAGENHVDHASLGAGGTFVASIQGVHSGGADDPIVKSLGPPFNVSVPIEHI